MRRPFDQSEFSRMSPEAQQRAMELYPELIDQFGVEGMTTPEADPEADPEATPEEPVEEEPIEEENPIFDNFNEVAQEEGETPEMQALAAAQQGDIFDEATFQEEAETPEQIPQQAQRTPAVDIGEMLRKQAEETDKLSLLKASARARDMMLNTESDMGMYEDMQARIDRPLKQLQLEQQLKEDQAKQDPNSQISIMARATLAELGMDMSKFEGVAFSQIEKMYPTLAQSLYTRVSANAKVASAKLEAEVKKQKLQQDALANKEKLELGRAKLKSDEKKTEALIEAKNQQQQANKDYRNAKSMAEVEKNIDKKVDQMLKSNSFKLYEGADESISLLEQAMKSKDPNAKIEKAAAFMRYAKTAQGDDSVVRNEDMKTLAGRFGFTNPKDMLKKFEELAAGGSFSPGELNAMKVVAMRIKALKKKYLNQNYISVIKAKADKSGYDLKGSISIDLLREFEEAEEDNQENKKQPTKQDIIKAQKSISDRLNAIKAREQELLKKQE